MHSAMNKLKQLRDRNGSSLKAPLKATLWRSLIPLDERHLPDLLGSDHNNSGDFCCLAQAQRRRALGLRMMAPSKTRATLDGSHYQVVVIGGGINGVAIARECARAGRRTLLVEQHDFASGTTSRSTRIIHGGLRYLEHGEIGLVRESLRERAKLLRERPHLVHPMHFLLALNEKSRRSAFTVRTGLWLYRRFGGATLANNSAELEQKRLERVLDSGHRWSVFNYEDAQCEFPERLVAEWAVEAAQAGATVRNHTQVLAIDIMHGRAKGVLLRDQLTGKDEKVEATWIINASGPWVDRLCQRSSLRSRRLVSGVSGSHIVLPHFAGAPTSAVYAEASDGRPFFVIPWNEQILVGTTEVPHTDDPAKVEPTSEEIDYLMRSVKKLFPHARISSQDIVYSFAGVRPLLAGESKTLGAISRKHLIHDHAADGAQRLISVVGGKLTTAAELARECALKVGARASKKSSLAFASGDSLDPLLDQWVIEIAEAGSISEGSARSIVEWHGKRSLDIARMALSSADLRAPLCPHTEHIVAEAVDAVANEYAASLGDILLRRVPVAWGACWSSSCSRQAAARIGAVLGWREEQMAAELESFEVERAAVLHRPKRSALSLELAAD
jgi:glycerol-3-phosphate dehydrogenase